MVAQWCWVVFGDHLPFSVTMSDVNGFPGCGLKVDAVTGAAFQTFVHGGWLAFNAHLGSLCKHLSPRVKLATNAGMCEFKYSFVPENTQIYNMISMQSLKTWPTEQPGRGCACGCKYSSFQKLGAYDVMTKCNTTLVSVSHWWGGILLVSATDEDEYC